MIFIGLSKYLNNPKSFVIWAHYVMLLIKPKVQNVEQLVNKTNIHPNILISYQIKEANLEIIVIFLNIQIIFIFKMNYILL